MNLTAMNLIANSNRSEGMHVVVDGVDTYIPANPPFDLEIQKLREEMLNTRCNSSMRHI